MPDSTASNRHSFSKFISPNRVVWTSINRHEWIVNRGQDTTNNCESIWIECRQALRKVSLTAMTTEELAVFKELMLTAIELAEPIVAALDAVARDDLAKGNDVNVRLYKPPAQLFRFGVANLPGVSNSERSEPGDDPSVSPGSPGVP